MIFLQKLIVNRYCFLFDLTDYFNQMNYKEALIGNNKPVKHAVSVSENHEVDEFMMRIKQENGLPSSADIVQISGELTRRSSELSELQVQILALEDQLKKRKGKRHKRLVLEMRSAIQLRIYDFLKNSERIDPETLHMIVLSYQPKDESEKIDPKDLCYLNAILMYKMILANSQHQEEKNVACLELALHELRIGNVSEADIFASLILDDSMKRVYNWRKKIGSY